MKTIALLLALASSALAADPLKPFLGSWTGQHKEKTFHTTLTNQIRLEGKRLPDGTVRLIARQPKNPSSFLTYHDFRPNGTFRRTYLYLNSRTVDVRGTWKRENGEIVIKGKWNGIQDLAGKVQVSKRTLSYTWKDLDGHTTSIRVHR